jgi:hypothetical protein
MKNNSKYANLTKDEAIKEILKDVGFIAEFINNESRIYKAMDEAFREGWHRGEEYGYEAYGKK